MNPISNPNWAKLVWDPLKNTKIVTMPLPVPSEGAVDLGNGVTKILAGTPLDEDGNIANDSDAVGILADDYFIYAAGPTNRDPAPVIVSGYVDKAAAEEHSGLEYDSDAISALETAGVYLVEGAPGSGGGGGSLPDYTADDEGKVLTLVPKMEQFTLIDEQSVYFDGNGEAHLAENSFRLPGGVDVVGKAGHVTITVGSDTATLDGTFFDFDGIFLNASAEVWGDELGIGVTFTGEYAGGVGSGISSATATISAYMDVESEAVEPKWVAGGALVLEVSYPTEASAVLNKTWKEIKDASNKVAIIFHESDGDADYFNYVEEIGYSEGDSNYYVQTMSGVAYYAETENDYPSYGDESDPGGSE